MFKRFANHLIQLFSYRKTERGGGENGHNGLRYAQTILNGVARAFNIFNIVNFANKSPECRIGYYYFSLYLSLCVCGILSISPHFWSVITVLNT